MFGDDLPKQVKDLTEVNRVDKKVTTSTGSFSRSQFDSRNSRNYTSHSSSRDRGYRYGRKFFFRRAIQRPTSQTVTPKEGETRTDEVDRSLDHVSNNNVEVSMSNDFIAGCLKQFSSQWKLITSDRFILDSVSHYKIEFVAGFPQQEVVPREICFSIQEQNIIQNEIDKLLTKGVIKETTHCAGEYISFIFIRPKKDGTYRLILNLKNLNDHVEYHHFKMDTLQSAIRLMKQNCCMASVDLRDAYYSVPIDKEY